MEDTKTRKKNFSLDEQRVLEERFAERKEYLTASFNLKVQGEKVTREGKHKKWAEITEAVNSLGNDRRTPKEVQSKWKNLVTEAKAKFHQHKNATRRTGGGPPPKPIPGKTERIIELMKDDASFKGNPGGGFSIFKPKPNRVSPLEVLGQMENDMMTMT